MSKSVLDVRSVALTSAALFAIGVLVLALRGTSASMLFEGAHPWSTQLLLGALAGAALAFGQLLLVRVWPGWRSYTLRAVAGLRLSAWEIAAIALMVAIAEELTYRGALQPLLGLWATSALFALAHVRLQRSAWRRPDRPYAVAAVGLLLAVSVSMALLFVHVGLLGAMAAHFVYDLVVLHGYVRAGRGGHREVAGQRS